MQKYIKEEYTNGTCAKKIPRKNEICESNLCKKILRKNEMQDSAHQSR